MTSNERWAARMCRLEQRLLAVMLAAILLVGLIDVAIYFTIQHQTQKIIQLEMELGGQK